MVDSITYFKMLTIQIKFDTLIMELYLPLHDSYFLLYAHSLEELNVNECRPDCRMA